MPICVRVLAALVPCLLLCTAATAKQTHARSIRTSPDELYSRRALRRARLLIEMRLLELRYARLECVRQAILRNLPKDLRPPERRARDEGARPLNTETCDILFP